MPSAAFPVPLFLQGEVGNRWADIAKRLTGRTENAVKIRWKALNRRQRDARNKAAAAAAAASGGGGGAGASVGGDGSKTSTASAARTGAREGTRAAARAAARTAAHAATVSPTTSGLSTTRREGRSGSGGGSTGDEESSQGSDSDSPRLATGRRSSLVIAADSCVPSTELHRRPASLPGAMRAAAAAAATAMTNSTLGAQGARGFKAAKNGPSVNSEAALRSLAFATDLECTSGGGPHQLAPVHGSGSGDPLSAVEVATEAATTAEAVAAALGRDKRISPPPDSSYIVSDTPFSSIRAEVAGGGLHRLCAALRNVEAMDNLQGPDDDRATAAPVRRRRSPPAGERPENRTSPPHSTSDVGKDGSPASSGTGGHTRGERGEEKISRSKKRVKSFLNGSGGRGSCARASPSPTSLLPLVEPLLSPTALELNYSRPSLPSASRTERSCVVPTATIIADAQAPGDSLRSLTGTKRPRANGPEAAAATTSAESVTGDMAGVTPGDVRSRLPSGASSPGLARVATAAAVSSEPPVPAKDVVQVPAEGNRNEDEETGRHAAATEQHATEQQAARDRATAAAAVASLCSFQAQLPPKKQHQVRSQVFSTVKATADAIGGKRARGPEPVTSTAKASRILESPPPAKRGRSSSPATPARAPGASSTATISKSSGMAAVFAAPPTASMVN